MGKQKKERSRRVRIARSDDFGFGRAGRMRPFWRHGRETADFRVLPGISQISMAAMLPNVDIVDNGRTFTIKADIPGVEKKNIKLKVAENSLMISAQRREEKETKGKNYYSHEGSSVGFYREMALPGRVRSETARAKYENGILTVEVRKITPTSPESREVRAE
jgi:HSP20 family protein